MSTKRIRDHRGFFQSDSNYVERALALWKPTSFELSEKQQENALFAWLRQCLPDVPMIAQYGLAKGRADIVIEEKHLIELKLGFTADKVADFDRCIGQMERYKQKWVKKRTGPVYLLVVGESDPEFRDLLHVWFGEANSDAATWTTLLDDSSPFTLIELAPPRA